MKTLPTWAEKLNELGAKHTPCFFTINYQGTQGHVFPLYRPTRICSFFFLREDSPNRGHLSL